MKRPLIATIIALGLACIGSTGTAQDALRATFAQAQVLEAQHAEGGLALRVARWQRPAAAFQAVRGGLDQPAGISGA